MHCHPALRHLHDRADGPNAEQIECQVQLHHRLTIARARRLDRLTVELLPNSPVGVSPLLFRPPDGPAAVNNLDTPPDIAQPSMLRSEIAAGISHWEITPPAHSCSPLELRRPHVHCVVYVCVCICVYIYIYICVCVFVCVCVCGGGGGYQLYYQL